MTFGKRLRTSLMVALAALALSFGLSLARAAIQSENIQGQGWQTAPRHTTGLAPDPLQWRDTAIVQVYAAPTYGWRGLFAVHPWIIFKRAGESDYTRYDVIGWGGDNVIRRDYALPDGLWYGSQPTLLVDQRGVGVNGLVDQIEAAITSYPYPHSYHAWPGPNSNTFLAHIGREVPALGLDLPANAIGKDYRPLTQVFGRSSSGRGVQVSLFGLLGLSVGIEEGIEFNVLGLDFGVDFNSLGLRLPFIGRIGMDDTTRKMNN
ncbi:DUF3750 domain-containing protein [Rhodoferax sp. U11-2br]|uniref:DUF3750 domain-containing protein n=1 Tax=Rhodoferax sp. U11-2br TaxID=2838878 RepID=UPI001BE6D013|nr:DUF3750 domain-containing protein [Rhodoferax sp. U11-2br]MBT3068083.1 DUF3750 domain-containing protein [Rhodoferax sp. U11-2br]